MLMHMARPVLPRSVAIRPVAYLFRPGGIPSAPHVPLSLAELEALRLSDHERLPQLRAAARMGVSRQTFGRILGGARRRVAEALVLGKALRIEGAECGGAPLVQLPRRRRR